MQGSICNGTLLAHARVPTRLITIVVHLDDVAYKEGDPKELLAKISSGWLHKRTDAFVYLCSNSGHPPLWPGTRRRLGLCRGQEGRGSAFGGGYASCGCGCVVVRGVVRVLMLKEKRLQLALRGAWGMKIERVRGKNTTEDE